MPLLKINMLLILSLLLISCSNAVVNDSMQKKPLSVTDMTPALVIASPKNTQLLNQAVSKALNGIKVNLSPNTFTQTHKMSTERVAQDKIGQQGMNGRMLATPENASHHFSLYRHAESCYLVNDKNEKIYPIEGLDCQ